MRSKRTHRHRANATSSQPYAGGAIDERAAGGVTFVDTCRCGAQRTTHESAGFVDASGAWSESRE